MAPARKVLYLLVTIILIVAIFFFTKAVITGKTVQQPARAEALYEITETDIFSLPSFHAEEVSVQGVMLGDTYEQVVEKLGIPDRQFTPKQNYLNMEYSAIKDAGGKKMKLAGTGLIIQLRDDTVKKITFREPFNPFLLGKTKITNSKEEIYINVVGKPDETVFVPETPTSVKVIRLLQYKSKGVEILIQGGEQIGFTLTTVFDSR